MLDPVVVLVSVLENVGSTVRLTSYCLRFVQ